MKIKILIKLYNVEICTIHYNMPDFVIFVQSTIQSISYWDLAQFVAFNIVYLKFFISKLFKTLKYEIWMFKNKELREAWSMF
jgi:uncharacterized protein Usg